LQNKPCGDNGSLVLGGNEPRAAPYDNYKVKKKVIYLPFIKLQGQ
jgi:hypothetical protein